MTRAHCHGTQYNDELVGARDQGARLDLAPDSVKLWSTRSATFFSLKTKPQQFGFCSLETKPQQFGSPEITPGPVLFGFIVIVGHVKLLPRVRHSGPWSISSFVTSWRMHGRSP